METIKQEGTNDKHPRFSTENLNEKCMSVGKILNVESYPITPIQGEFNDVKDYLTDQRFYLTNAYKNDGEDKSNYKHKDKNGIEFPLDEDKAADFNVSKAHSYSISQSGRYPTMASMRAPVLCTLHTYKWKFGACPKGPSWAEPPVTITRKSGQVFCHYINNHMIATREEAIAHCESNGFGAALTGFDSAEEFDMVRKHVMPVYPPDAELIPEVPRKSLAMAKVRKNGIMVPVDYHYWLGGKSPCKVDCHSRSGLVNGAEVASWDKGVALNTIFLNTYNHDGHKWVDIGDPQYVSFRHDMNAFHIHIKDNPYVYMMFICGTTAPLERGDRSKAKPKVN